jgi:hypothetical protein
MRLDIGTVRGKWVNFHLLVSPEDPDHLVELKRFLAHLTFSAYDDFFRCNKDDLIRLGQRFDAKLTDPVAALECGSEQFKRTFPALSLVILYDPTATSLRALEASSVMSVQPSERSI